MNALESRRPARRQHGRRRAGAVLAAVAIQATTLAAVVSMAPPAGAAGARVPFTSPTFAVNCFGANFNVSLTGSAPVDVRPGEQADLTDLVLHYSGMFAELATTFSVAPSDASTRNATLAAGTDGYVTTGTSAGARTAALTPIHLTVDGSPTGAPSVDLTLGGVRVDVGGGTSCDSTNPPVAVSIPIVDRPANDDLVDAEVLPGRSGSVSGSNVDATSEVGEATSVAGLVRGASVWYSWTAPLDGDWVVDTCGTGFDTVLGVWTGTDVATANLAAQDDDGCTGGASEVTVSVTAGETFLVEVSGRDDGLGGGPAQGAITLNWAMITAPGAVPSAAAVAHPGYVTVSWAPASDGGSPLTVYGITAFRNGKEEKFVGADPSWSSVDITLVDGATYQFTVGAANAYGQGFVATTQSVTVISRYRPFASWEALADSQAKALTGAVLPAAERTSLVFQLDDGALTPGELAEGFRRGTENAKNVDPVARLYRAFLARTPDASGLRFWINRRRAGTWTLTRMADSFASSKEFVRKYGALSNEAFVRRIYTDVLGRTADEAGVTFWTKRLATKAKTRGGVMVNFSESNEYKTKQVANTDAAVAYILLVGRAPSTSEFAAWVASEKADPTQHDDLLDDLVHSAAYATHITGV